MFCFLNPRALVTLGLRVHLVYIFGDSASVCVGAGGAGERRGGVVRYLHILGRVLQPSCAQLRPGAKAYR